jgi:exonuclease VII small subunit
LEKAIRIYQRGMEEAKRAGDQHALNELRGALEDIEDEAVN